MATGLQKVVELLHQAGDGLTDGQLLTRFVLTRDESAFALLVRRHGPMVLGVCRRLLHDFHDAEDAFQATFLVLARKAGSVVKRESLGCWLYQVAYHTALEACAAVARRRGMERQMKDLPQPETAPAEAQDWRPVLDRELNRLPEKYRGAVVLCDLEGQPRKEAARQLGIPEGTLSSRLATARKLLAKRLTGAGVVLSAGGVVALLAESAASAQVAAPLLGSTAQAAALVAAGQLTAVSTPAVVLMRGVLKVMLVRKLKMIAGAVVVLAALGAGGIAFRAGDNEAAAQPPAGGRQPNEVEALRKENELLKLNLQVVLEKVRSQEAEIQTLRGRRGGGGGGSGMPMGGGFGFGGSSSGGMEGAPGGMPFGGGQRPGGGSGGMQGFSGGGGGGGGMQGFSGGGGGFGGMQGFSGGLGGGMGGGGMPGMGGPAGGKMGSGGPPGSGGGPGAGPAGGPPGAGGPGIGGAPGGAPGAGGVGGPGIGGAPGAPPGAGGAGAGTPGGFPGGRGGRAQGAARGNRPAAGSNQSEYLDQVEAAVAALKAADGDKQKQQRALDALEKALKKLKDKPEDD